MWNPFRSKLAAAILGGIDKIHMAPGSKVLYLGAASGTTVSHVSDIVGPVSNDLLHPNISMHILHTDLYTFPRVLTRRICQTIKSLCSC